MLINDSFVRAEHQYRAEQLKSLYQSGRASGRESEKAERPRTGRARLMLAKLRSA